MPACSHESSPHLAYVHLAFYYSLVYEGTTMPWLPLMHQPRALTHAPRGQQGKRALVTLVTPTMSSAADHRNKVEVPEAVGQGISNFGKHQCQSTTRILHSLLYTLLRPSCKHYECSSRLHIQSKVPGKCPVIRRVVVSVLFRAHRS